LSTGDSIMKEYFMFRAKRKMGTKALKLITDGISKLKLDESCLAVEGILLNKVMDELPINTPMNIVKFTAVVGVNLAVKRLVRMYKKLKKDGKIKNDYCESELGRKTLNELLDYIDEGKYKDERMFNVMKATAFKIWTNDKPIEFDPMSYLEVLSELSSREFLVMIECKKYGWKWKKDGFSVHDYKIKEHLLHSLGIKHYELLDGMLHVLEELKLVSSSLDRRREWGGLTGLGYSILDYVMSSAYYEDIQKNN